VTDVSPGLTGFTAEAVLGSLGVAADRVVVGGAMFCDVCDGRRLLVLRRAPHQEFGGIEELPSGQVEPGESLGRALRREILEETGIVIDAIGEHLFCFRYDSTKGRTVQCNFVIDLPSAAEVCIAPLEHTGFRWISRQELDQSALTDSVKEGLRRSW
jgi:8-oxo-dGTP diphosphatase